jgi:hypothetical protein
MISSGSTTTYLVGQHYDMCGPRSLGFEFLLWPITRRQSSTRDGPLSGADQTFECPFESVVERPKLAQSVSKRILNTDHGGTGLRGERDEAFYS